MSQVRENFTVCDGCGGAIPDGAPRVTIGGAVIVIGDQSQSYSNLDFCSTAHVATYLESQPIIPIPDPLYPPPPQ